MTLIRRIFGPALALATLAACSAVDGPVARPVLSLDATQQRVATSGNDFSYALFRQLATSEAGHNVVVSPLSASMSLGMTLNGAAGATFDAMRSALRLGDADLGQIDAGYLGLIAALRGADPTTTFQIANAIWFNKAYTFRQAFLDTTRKYFDAQSQGLDFSDRAGSLATINGWVNAKTGGRIPTILDDVRPDEAMFLVNAIYFKGTWQVQFDPKATSTEPFYAADGTVQNVPFMHRDQYIAPAFRAGGARGLSMAELPYGNGDYAMDILLRPYVAKPNIDSVAATLTPAVFDSLVATLKDVTWALALPKFSVTYDRVLNDDLSALGMGVAFSPAADFSRLSPTAMAIEFVKQKTAVDVDETGTVAGASTVTGVIPVSLAELRVDRPFIFVIRERQTGTILFMGKVLRIP